MLINISCGVLFNMVKSNSLSHCRNKVDNSQIVHVANKSSIHVLCLCMNDWRTETQTHVMLAVFSVSAVSLYEDVNTWTSSLRVTSQAFNCFIWEKLVKSTLKCKDLHGNPPKKVWFKGVVALGFFLGLIVLMGCSQTCLCFVFLLLCLAKPPLVRV